MSNDTPFMRWHVDAYLGDTGHLTCVEHGAYTQILWACWKRGGSVPERHIPRLVGMTPNEWSESRDTLAEFFIVDDGQWSHRKVVEEMDHVNTRREAAIKAGKASGKARKPKETPLSKSANDERTFNGRSTDDERNPNHKEKEEDKELDKDCSLPTVENSEKLSLSPSDFIKRLKSDHDYQPSPGEQMALITQSKQWVSDGVTISELDYAVTKSREQLQNKGDDRDPPAAYLAKVIAGNRMKSTPIKTPPINTHGGFTPERYQNSKVASKFDQVGVE